jgi:hypothetical protein
MQIVYRQGITRAIIVEFSQATIEAKNKLEAARRSGLPACLIGLSRLI